MDRDSLPTQMAESYCEEDCAVPKDRSIPGAHARDDGTVLHDGTVLLSLEDVLHGFTKGASHVCSSSVWNISYACTGESDMAASITDGTRMKGFEIEASVEMHGSNAVARQLMFLRRTQISHPQVLQDKTWSPQLLSWKNTILPSRLGGHVALPLPGRPGCHLFHRPPANLVKFWGRRCDSRRSSRACSSVVRSEATWPWAAEAESSSAEVSSEAQTGGGLAISSDPSALGLAAAFFAKHFCFRFFLTDLMPSAASMCSTSLLLLILQTWSRLLRNLPNNQSLESICLVRDEHSINIVSNPSLLQDNTHTHTHIYGSQV